ncbi:MAG: hypothetical protein ABGX16_06410 [Pirellulales bacterium]
MDGGPFIDIAYLELLVDEITFSGNHSEYAIDNFSVNGGGSGFDPDNSFVSATTSIGTNRLNTGTSGNPTFAFQFDVDNLNFGGTTFSVTLDPTSDPQFTTGTPATAQFIGGNQSLSGGSDIVATIDTNIPSGDYQASATTTNDLNPLAPDITTTYQITIFDPPDLTDNSGAPIQANINPDLTLVNASAGPHAGAQRASAEVTTKTVSGAGFSVTGLEVGALADASETEIGTVQFDRYGRLSGTYSGMFSVELKMADPNRSFLNGAQPVLSVEWDINYDLGDLFADNATLAATDSYDKQVGVNNGQTAATLIDGTASTGQTLSLVLSANPEVGDTATSAAIAGDPIDLNFTTSGDLYVLQFTYAEGGLPTLETIWIF